jgi:hypothetical protein
MLTTSQTHSTGAAQAAPLPPTLAAGEPPAFRVWMCYTLNPNGHVESFGLSHSQAIANAVCLRHPEDIKEQSEADYLKELRVIQGGAASREDFILFAADVLQARLELAQLAVAEGWADVDQSCFHEFVAEHRPAREALAFG